MSRVHELRRLPLKQLIAMLGRLNGKAHGYTWEDVPKYGWNTDNVVAAIRDLEDRR